MLIGFLAAFGMAAFFSFAVWAMLKNHGGFRILAIPMIGAATFSIGLSLMFLSDLTGMSDFVRSDFEREVAQIESDDAS